MADTDTLFRSLMEQHDVAFPSPPPALSYGGSTSSSSTSATGDDPLLTPSPSYQNMSASSSEPSTPSFSLPGSYMSQSIPKLAFPSPMLRSVGSKTLLLPPNFGCVAEDVYRSSFPRAEHFPFLQSLGLKTVLTLVIEEYPEENREFLEREGIELIQMGMPNNKDPHAQIPGDTICKALAVVLDKRKHPLLIHCNRGKHRTGCLVGCLRKLQCWSACESLEEYSRYAHPKERVSDQNFITSFATEQIWPSLDIRWLPLWLTVENGSTQIQDIDVSMSGSLTADQHATFRRSLEQ